MKVKFLFMISGY